MGNSTEEGKNVKAEKLSPPPLSVYRTWSVAAPPFLNSAVASSPSTSHYLWTAPLQSMIPPHAAAFYAHYAHTEVPPVGSSPSVESAKNTDGGVSKKLKAIDGLSMSIGNRNFNINDHESSESEPNGGLTDGSNGTLAGASKISRERSRYPSLEVDVDSPNHHSTPASGGHVSEKAPVDAVPIDDDLETKIEIKSSEMNSFPSDAWLQKEREMKRERRKQSNRESARRSRLRKQAEAEELAKKVHQLTCDNLDLKAEMNKLMECSAKLKLQNAALMEKIKDSHIEDTDHHQRVKPVATMNLLARVNNSSSNDDRHRDDEQTAVYESRSTAKLRQLLDANSLRSDAVAAS